MAFGDLTTLADVKVWLQTGQAAFPATDDALLTRLVTAASQYIQTWLNRGIASADFLEVRDGVKAEWQKDLDELGEELNALDKRTDEEEAIAAKQPLLQHRSAGSGRRPRQEHHRAPRGASKSSTTLLRGG